MSLHEDRVRAGSFGEDALQYDRARPSYPAALVDDLLAGGARRVVDVGCGTGIAARLFATRGCEVVGVEADPRMAAVARAHGLTVEVAAFEAWSPPGPFDLLVCGQAWHWIDPVAGPAKAAEALRSGGRFAAFWNHEVHERRVVAAWRPVYERHAPHLLDGRSAVAGATGASDHGEDRRALEATGAFEAVEVRTYSWERRYTAAQWVDEAETHSGHRTLAADARRAVLDGVAAAIDTCGGAIRVAFTTVLVTALRR